MIRTLVVIVTLLCSAASLAEETRLRGTFRYSTLNVLRGNPIGLISENTVGYRYRLFEPDSLLFSDTYAGLSIVPTLSPAYLRMGVMAEVQPLAVIRLWARADVYYFLGTFDVLQSFSTPTADYSDTRLGELGDLPAGDPQKNYGAPGMQLTLGLDLKAKVGPVAIRLLSRLVRADMQLRAGDTVYFDQTYDMLAPNNGFFFTNDADILWMSDFGLIAGIRGTTTLPFYEDRHFGPGEDGTHENGPIFRTGPLIAYSFFNRPGELIARPTILMTAQWHLNHRWRTGADVDQAIPYAFIGFAMNGDF
jgi:hypothetical protein